MEDYPDYLPIILSLSSPVEYYTAKSYNRGGGEKKKQKTRTIKKKKRKGKKHPETRNITHILAEPHCRGGTARTFRGVHQLIEWIITIKFCSFIHFLTIP